jgi:hypothetical protein
MGRIFHKILGINEIPDKPAFETSKFHFFNGQSITAALSFFVRG